MSPKYRISSYSIDISHSISSPRVSSPASLKKYTDLHKILEVKWQDRTHVLTISEIVYLESNLRHVIFYTSDNSFRTVGKLDLYEQDLSPYGFLRCHQSFLVNMKFIKNIESNNYVIYMFLCYVFCV